MYSVVVYQGSINSPTLTGSYKIDDLKFNHQCFHFVEILFGSRSIKHALKVDLVSNKLVTGSKI